MTHPWLVLALVLASCPWMWAQRGSVCQVRVRSKSGKLDKQSWVLRNVCCKGYVGSPGNCRPRCSPSCVHAQCTAPQQCTCNEGYETVDSIDSSTMPGCQPKCNACRYGDCLAPGNCRCWPSFEKQPIVGCEPVQHLILPAEKCLREDCSCWQKYFSWTPLLTVQPKCIRICRTGQPKPCLELEQCVCNSLNHLLICEEPEHVLPQQYGCQVINGPPTAYRRKHTVKHIDRTVSTDPRDRKDRTDRPTKIFPVWTHHYNQSDEESKITQANREVQSDRRDKINPIVDQKDQESRADNTHIGSRIDHRPGRPDRLDRRHRKDQLERPDVLAEKVDRYHTYDSAQTDPINQTDRPVQTFHLFGKHKKNQTNQPDPTDPTDQVTGSDWRPQADENEEDHTENIYRREPKNWEYETDRLDQQTKRRKDHAKRYKQKPILFEADEITQADKSDQTDPVNQSDPATETVPVQHKSDYRYMTKSEQASLVKWLIILGCIIIGIIVVVSLFAVCFKMQSPLDICERDIM